MIGGVRRATLRVRVVVAVLLAASTLVWGATLAAAELSDEVNVTKSDESTATE